MLSMERCSRFWNLSRRWLDDVVKGGSSRAVLGDRMASAMDLSLWISSVGNECFLFSMKMGQRRWRVGRRGQQGSRSGLSSMKPALHGPQRQARHCEDHDGAGEWCRRG